MEIRFRGKNISLNLWIYGSYIKHNEQSLIHPVFEYPYQYPVDLDENCFPESIGQFTGKQDRHGIDIYNGDILEFDKEEWGGDDNIHIVSWDEKEAAWNWGGGTTSDMNYRTVIGNTFDNPKLKRLP